MAALIIVDLIVTDKDRLAAYSTLAAESLVAYGGEYLARGAIEVLHGKSIFQTKVVIQFPNRDSAVNWYESDTYQQIIPMRDQAIKCQFHLVG